MAERTGYTEGEPCWADVMSPDPETARRFYQVVFGWTYDIAGPEFGGYSMCLADGVPVAGLSPIGEETQGTPPTWSVYLAAPDVDETAQRTVKAGGQVVMGPMDIPGSGRMAFGLDPAGAGFGLWQAGGHTGFGRVDTPGTFVWAELHTGRPDRVDAFYRELFPYAQEQTGDGAAFDYSTWSLDGRPACGRMTARADEGEAPSYWMIYFAVDDADAAAARIAEAGGAVLRPPHDSPYGRIAVVADPAGARFSILDTSRTTRI